MQLYIYNVAVLVWSAQINIKCSPKGDRAVHIWSPVHFVDDDKDHSRPWSLSKPNDKLSTLYHFACNGLSRSSNLASGQNSLAFKILIRLILNICMYVFLYS